jgi:hypothetical protein
MKSGRDFFIFSSFVAGFYAGVFIFTDRGLKGKQVREVEKGV